MSRNRLFNFLQNLKRLPGRAAVIESMYTESKLSRVAAYQSAVMLRYLLADNIAKLRLTEKNYRVVTDHKVALQSNDHLYPLGALTDVTHSPQLVNWANSFFGRKIQFMDLGCAGGGVVCDFLLHGHEAIGIEGSSVPEMSGTGFWPFLANTLFTADITKPFQVIEQDKNARFDLITAWEVLEHIPEKDVYGLLSNIKSHLKPDGLFIGSIAQFESIDPASGVDLHINVNSQKWWTDQFTGAGFEILENPPIWSMSRGSGNRTATDWDASLEPHLGFHIAVKILNH
jgi:SAM-dependent methyltransferase